MRFSQKAAVMAGDDSTTAIPPVWRRQTIRRKPRQKIIVVRMN